MDRVHVCLYCLCVSILVDAFLTLPASFRNCLWYACAPKDLFRELMKPSLSFIQTCIQGYKKFLPSTSSQISVWTVGFEVPQQETDCFHGNIACSSNCPGGLLLLCVALALSCNSLCSFSISHSLLHGVPFLVIQFRVQDGLLLVCLGGKIFSRGLCRLLHCKQCTACSIVLPCYASLLFQVICV